MHFEQGRTLIEMLGVLAVYGIIIITGVSSFRYLINKHHANTILNEAQMHATLLAANTLNHELPESTVLNNLGYPFTYKKESEVAYSLNLTDVNKSVCQILGGTHDLKWAETVLVNNGADCTDQNTVTFYVNVNMTNQTTDANRVVPCENDTDCGECGTCALEQKVCVFDDTPCTNTYGSEKAYCNRGTCQKCIIGKFHNNYTCYNCDHPTIGLGATANECRACRGQRFFHPNNMCYRCDWNSYIPVYHTDCISCPQRYMRTINSDGIGNCFYCPGTLNSDKTECYFNCPKDYFGGINNGQCISCDSPEEFVTTNPTECRKCAGKRFHRTGAYQCALCSSNYIFYGNVRSDCLSCPQRYMTGTDEKGTCSLCSGFVNLEGTACHSCDKIENTATTEIRCNQCKGVRYYDNGNCILCPDNVSGLTSTQQEQCTQS